LNIFPYINGLLNVYQWFIKVKDFTDEIIEAGEQMKWYPEKHKQRLIDWCEGLDWNWVISRQRVFGTPIPFWYCKDCGEIIPPKKEDLPLDPVKTPPPVNECPKCKSKNIEGEKDVCDCWIDSSITPLAISKWLEDNTFFQKTYMEADVHRPQGYEIIRTWLFYTLFRCKKLTGKAPFSEIMINGMVAGPDGRKMSKSFGNIVSPDEIMPDFGADAIRQWAAMGSLGDDYPFEYTWINIHTKEPVSEEIIREEMKKLSPDKFNKKYRRRFEQLIGASRFLTKIWNAYRFLKINLDKVEISDIKIKIEDLSPIDCYFYHRFNECLEQITNYFDGYNWNEGFKILRPFFWYELCDDYIEAIKYKFYLEEENIQIRALINALNLFYNVLKIFSVIMPFISEEIYSLIFKKFINLKSIHLESWPIKYSKLNENLIKRGKLGIDVIRFIRMCKSKMKIPLNQEINKIIIGGKKKDLKELDLIKSDIIKTLRIKKLLLLNLADIREKIDKAADFKKIYEERDLNFYFFK